MSAEWTHVRVRRTTLARLQSQIDGLSVALNWGALDLPSSPDCRLPGFRGTTIDQMLALMLDQRDARRMRRVLAARRARAARRRPRHAPQLPAIAADEVIGSDESDPMEATFTAHECFFHAWVPLMDANRADCWGGMECRRIYGEWLAAGRPAPVGPWLDAALALSARSDGGVP